ncbi:MAG: endonuclease/exonuclease/phosphatase family protein [Patescibacteria group bacterium]
MRKLILQNVGYFRGMDGSLTDTCMKWPRFLYAPPSVQRAAMDEFKALVERERPDSIFLTEVHQGALDNGYLDQAATLGAKHAYEKAIVKYDPKTAYERLWFFSGKSNAYFGEAPRSIEHFFLSEGAKRLVMTVHLDWARVYLVHLATLSAPMRARQMAEIARMIPKRGRTIVCGDFNVFGGVGELQPLLDAGLVLVDSAPTFPASLPRYPLDLFLVSPALAARARARVIAGVRYSDHLPVILELYDSGYTVPRA